MHLIFWPVSNFLSGPLSCNTVYYFHLLLLNKITWKHFHIFFSDLLNTNNKIAINSQISSKSTRLVKMYEKFVSFFKLTVRQDYFNLTDRKNNPKNLTFLGIRNEISPSVLLPLLPTLHFHNKICGIFQGKFRFFSDRGKNWNWARQ